MFLWVRGLSIAKNSVLYKLIIRFNAIPCKHPTGFLVEIDEQILKFIWIFKRFQETKTFLKNKYKAEGL